MSSAAIATILRMPSNPISTVAVRVDSETLEWFRSKGEESEQHMAAALKIYAAAQKMAAGMSKSNYGVKSIPQTEATPTILVNMR